MRNLALVTVTSVGLLSLVGFSPAEARTHHRHVAISSSCGPTAYSRTRTRVGVAQDEPSYYSVHRRSTRIERSERPQFGSVEYRREHRSGSGVDVNVNTRSRTDVRTGSSTDARKDEHTSSSATQSKPDAATNVDRGSKPESKQVGASEPRGEKVEGRSSSENRGNTAGKMNAPTSGAAPKSDKPDTK